MYKKENKKLCRIIYIQAKSKAPLFKGDDLLLDLNISFDNIDISNVKINDVYSISKWIKLNFKDEDINIDNIYESFFESLISENEFFSKIRLEKENKLAGILKGRLEFKNFNDAWIKCFYVDDSEIGKNIKSNIIKKMEEYFVSEYMIKNIFVIVDNNNEESLKLWEDQNYRVIKKPMMDSRIFILKKGTV